MAAILGMDAPRSSHRLRRSGELRLNGEVVEAVNFNDPKQTVIAGSKAAVEKACEVLKAAVPSVRCRCRCLRLSIPA